MSSIKKTSLFLFSLRILKMFLSLITFFFIAKFFGISVERDVWILVTTFLAAINSAIWGPLNETFRAKFIFIKEKDGELSAINQTNSLLGFVILVTLFVSILITVFSNEISLFMMKNFENQSHSQFIHLLLILLPTYFISQLSAIGISVLNSYSIFYIPEFVSIISVLLNIPIIVLFAPTIGIYSLVIAQYFSVIILLFGIVYYLKRNNINIKINIFHIRINYIKGFVFFSLPFFLPYFFGQLNILAEKWLAGLLGEGSISSIDYARQFSSITQGVLGSVLMTVMVPILAKAFVNRNKVLFTSVLDEFLIISFVILMFVVPIIFGAASPLSDVFFNRGSISSNDIVRISNLMQLYAISLYGIVLYMIFGYALLSSNKGKLFARWGVINQLFILLLNCLFLNKFSIYVFPMSLGISHLICAIILGTYLEIDNRYKFYMKIIKYSIVVLVITIILYVLNERVNLSSSLLQLFANIAILIFLVPIISIGLGYNLNYYRKKYFRNL